MKNNKLLISIIIIFIIIVIISIILLTMNNNNLKNENEIQNQNQEIINVNNEIEDNSNIQNVPPDFSNDVSFQEYFTVSNCISKSLDETIIFSPISIKKLNSGNVVNYTIYGVILDLNMNYIRDLNSIVKLDTKNLTFLIDDNKEQLEKIESKNDNTFVYQELSDNYKFKQIFYNMKYLLLSKPEKFYNYLEEDYRDKRFGSYDKFLNYFNNNKNHLLSIIPKNYKIGETINDVKIRDQYGNWYEFKINGVLDYTVKLDNYIVMSEEDIEQYKKYDNGKKIKYNIQKWINMINSKDYEFAYNYLDETFKQQNYETLDKFKNLMQSKYPDYYDNVSVQIKNEGSVYSSEVQLSVKDDEYADKYMTIIMKLKEGTDFVLSFDVQ